MTPNEKDIDTLARTIWGEARGEGIDGMEAVASVVMNRYEVARQEKGYWWGNTVTEVCRQPWQFSCWNEKDPNRPKLLTADQDTLSEAIEIAQDAIWGVLPDFTNGATHYLNPKVLDIIPSWARGEPLAIIGKHYFYRPPEVPAIVKKFELERNEPWKPSSTLSHSTPPNSSPSPGQLSAGPSSGWLKKLLQKLTISFWKRSSTR